MRGRPKETLFRPEGINERQRANYLNFQLIFELIVEHLRYFLNENILDKLMIFCKLLSVIDFLYLQSDNKHKKVFW